MNAKILELAGKAGFKVAKTSPHLFIAGGILGMIGTIVLASKATLKADEVKKTHREKMDRIQEAIDTEEEGYTEEDIKKDRTVVMAQTAFDWVKLYGPSALLGTVSIASILTGHRVQFKRYTAALSAFGTLAEGFNRYRARVIKEHGDETDYLYANGFKEVVTKEDFVDDDGKKKKREVSEIQKDEIGGSGQTLLFDESCTQWSSDPMINKMSLKAIEDNMNVLLNARGHVFLNEVYDRLGAPRTKEGSIIGWKREETDRISFGLYAYDMAKRIVESEGAPSNAKNYRYALALEEMSSPTLTFNTNGIIWDRI